MRTIYCMALLATLLYLLSCTLPAKMARSRLVVGKSRANETVGQITKEIDDDSPLYLYVRPAKSFTADKLYIGYQFPMLDDSLKSKELPKELIELSNEYLGPTFLAFNNYGSVIANSKFALANQGDLLYKNLTPDEDTALFEALYQPCDVRVKDKSSVVVKITLDDLFGSIEGLKPKQVQSFISGPLYLPDWFEFGEIGIPSPSMRTCLASGIPVLLYSRTDPGVWPALISVYLRLKCKGAPLTIHVLNEHDYIGNIKLNIASGDNIKRLFADEQQETRFVSIMDEYLPALRRWANTGYVLSSLDWDALRGDLPLRDKQVAEKTVGLLVGNGSLLCGSEKSSELSVKQLTYANDTAYSVQAGFKEGISKGTWTEILFGKPGEFADFGGYLSLFNIAYSSGVYITGNSMTLGEMATAEKSLERDQALYSWGLITDGDLHILTYTGLGSETGKNVEFVVTHLEADSMIYNPAKLGFYFELPIDADQDFARAWTGDLEVKARSGKTLPGVLKTASRLNTHGYDNQDDNSDSNSAPTYDNSAESGYYSPTQSEATASESGIRGYYVILASYALAKKASCEQRLAHIIALGIVDANIVYSSDCPNWTPDLWVVAIGPIDKAAAVNRCNSLMEAVPDAYVKYSG